MPGHTEVRDKTDRTTNVRGFVGFVDDPEVRAIGSGRSSVPRRELLTLLVYVETGSHKAAAHRLAISESTCRQRISQLLGRLGATNAAQAVWQLRHELEAEEHLGADTRRS